MSSPGSLQRDERLRLFLALQLPEHVLDRVAPWQERELRGAGRIVPREHLHITLAFLGSRPKSELAEIIRALEEAVRPGCYVELELDRYRETRSVAMLVLRDISGHATALAGEVQERLETLGVYRREARPWLPHLTVVRFRTRPRLHPTLPQLGPFAPSDAAAFLSRLHPSGTKYGRGSVYDRGSVYEVLQSFPLSE